MKLGRKIVNKRSFQCFTHDSNGNATILLAFTIVRLISIIGRLYVMGSLVELITLVRKHA